MVSNAYDCRYMENNIFYKILTNYFVAKNIEAVNVMLNICVHEKKFCSNSFLQDLTDDNLEEILDAQHKTDFNIKSYTIRTIIKRKNIVEF